MHAIFHPSISFFHPFKNKVHQNSQVIDLMWHYIIAKWNSQLFFNYVIFYLKNILMINTHYVQCCTFTKLVDTLTHLRCHPIHMEFLKINIIM